MALTRRSALQLGLAGGAAMMLPFHRMALTAGINRIAVSAMPAPFTLPFRRPAELTPSGTTAFACPDGNARSYPYYRVTQQFTVAEVMPGFHTPLFGYNGLVPGPTIRARRGQPIVVRQANALHRPPDAPFQNSPMPSQYTPDPMLRTTSTHLHGSPSLPMYDGYASDITAPAYVKEYFYPNSQESRMMWYHDHGIHHTSHNAYNGLAGMYILHDDDEDAANLPSMDDPESAAYDVPMVIRDAMFDAEGRLIYDDNGQSGIYGDVPLVNGIPWPVMEVEPRLYRFRLLNASVSRSYVFQLNDGRAPVPITMVGTDAGLMPEPQTVTNFRHGMAERYDFVVDFSHYAGAEITMLNLSPPNNIDFETMTRIMRFRVKREVPTTLARNRIAENWTDVVPKAECMSWTLGGLRAQGVTERNFEFRRGGGQWTVNGETWNEVINSGFTHCIAEVPAESIEIWHLINTSGGWFHPVHIHLVDFQVLTRNGLASEVRPFERGPKDTVYVGESDTVAVAMRFGGHAAGPGWQRPQGRYMMHCHNLVHEDHDMMVQFNVGDPSYDPALDPITAASAWPGV